MFDFMLNNTLKEVLQSSLTKGCLGELDEVGCRFVQVGRQITILVEQMFLDPGVNQPS